MVRPLSAQEMLIIWERGLHQHPVERALTTLNVAMPALAPDALLALSIGQRDACLLTLHEATFGVRLESFVECPACQERLEFTLNVTDIRVTDEREGATSEQQALIDGYEVRFRLPNSRDLITIARLLDVKQARSTLVERCIIEAKRDGETVVLSKLPESVIVGLAEQMACLDPQAEVQLNLSCPACGHRWSLLFDIVSFLWTEIGGQAKRLLHNVHILARAYGWREADILSMSAVRRQYYLEMVT
jgi:T4 bacteriophage base plate protein